MKKAMAYVYPQFFKPRKSLVILIMFSSDHTQAHAVWSQHLDLGSAGPGWEEAKKLLLPGVGLASFRDHADHVASAGNLEYSSL